MATASVPTTANVISPAIWAGPSGSVVSERAAAVQAAAECPARALQIQVRIWVLGEQVWAAVHGCSASKYGLQSMARVPEFSVLMVVATPQQGRAWPPISSHFLEEIPFGCDFRIGIFRIV